MSTNGVNNVCQNLVAFIDGALTPWFVTVQEKLQVSAQLPLTLSPLQLALAAAWWPEKEKSKIIILDENPQAAYRFHTSLCTWSKLKNVSYNWHLINGPLTPQEQAGHIVTDLSRAVHLLLAGDNHSGFVITDAALATPLPDPSLYREAQLALALGEQCTLHHLIKHLTRLGYTRHRGELEPGSFVVRGENIVIAHPVLPHRYTLTLWRNTIERIVHSDTRPHPLTSLTLPPVSLPETTTPWAQLLADSMLFQPSRLTELISPHTIITDALDSLYPFPLVECRPNTPHPPARQYFVLYQNQTRLQQYLADHQLTAQAWCQSELASTNICLSNRENTIVSEEHLLPARTSSRPIAYEQGLTLIQALTPGKPAVHSDHGIGMFEGLQTKTYADFPREYLLLRYAAGDTLAVPVEYAHKVTAYLGDSHPAINRLHDAAWAKTKKAAASDALRFARELLRIAGRRKTSAGHAYNIDPNIEEQLSATFPHTLTADQAQVWEEVKADLQSPHSMDRVVVGDVGFGKTEIAIRAARHVAENNKQVAMLAPTTLLVQQHLDSFRSRLPNMAENIGVLSRFATPRETREVKAKIARGELQIVIGTHALLSDIAWPALGLVIIDEEQRFGVRHKEHFKKIRASLDILSLSATPIPRTLSMALSNLKQLSVISTPPPGRKSIVTHVGPDDDAIITNAIAQEKARGGQVYVVSPRVRAIPALTARLRQLLPQLSIAFAHGQQTSRELAQTIKAFDAGELDVLVASSIIEHGLDLPNANTLIVTGATRFGLADLYQLRGRIGRRERVGFAYFLYNQGLLTQLQKQRLAALTEASRLGSGWMIARRDLELRGAGNLLGAEQSGIVNNVGVQLYLDLVRDASERSNSTLNYQDVDIRLPVPALIPPHYIADSTERARVYQTLARARNTEQLAKARSRLEQAFGPLPPETKNLYRLLILQHLAARAGITTIAGTTISPPSQEPFVRLEVAAKNPPQLLPALSSLGIWTARGEMLYLDVAAMTPQLLKNLVRALEKAHPLDKTKSVM